MYYEMVFDDVCSSCLVNKLISLKRRKCGFKAAFLSFVIVDRNFISFQAVVFSKRGPGGNNRRRHEDAESASQGDEIKINLWKLIQQGQEAKGSSATEQIRMRSQNCLVVTSIHIVPLLSCVYTVARTSIKAVPAAAAGFGLLPSPAPLSPQKRDQLDHVVQQQRAAGDQGNAADDHA